MCIFMHKFSLHDAGIHLCEVDLAGSERQSKTGASGGPAASTATVEQQMCPREFIPYIEANLRILKLVPIHGGRGRTSLKTLNTLRVCVLIVFKCIRSPPAAGQPLLGT